VNLVEGLVALKKDEPRILDEGIHQFDIVSGIADMRAVNQAECLDQARPTRLGEMMEDDLSSHGPSI
jgi:hypothetical protein